MSAEYICDGCGKREPAENYNGQFHKPRHWYVRGDKDGTQTACSRECIQKVADKSGKTSVVLPF